MALLAAAALLVMCLQRNPAHSMVDSLRTASTRGPQKWEPGRGGGHHHSRLATAVGERVLSFDVCGDHAMQRIALLSGQCMWSERPRLHGTAEMSCQLTLTCLPRVSCTHCLKAHWLVMSVPNQVVMGEPN